MQICCRQKKKKFYSKTPDTPAFLQVFNQGRSARITGSSSFDFQVCGRPGQRGGWGRGAGGSPEPGESRRKRSSRTYLKVKLSCLAPLEFPCLMPKKASCSAYLSKRDSPEL